MTVQALCCSRIAALMVLALTALSNADACSCTAQTACDLPKDFPLIFVGRAIRKQIVQTPQVRRTNADGPVPSIAPGAPSTVTFAVSEYLNGQAGADININTSEGCCACGFLFTVGVEYLVFASEHRGAWSTGTCTPTQSLATGVALREQLRAAKSYATVAQIYGFAGRAPKDSSREASWNLEPIGSMRIQAMGTRANFEVLTSTAGAFSFSGLPADIYRIEPVVPPGLTPAQTAIRTSTRTFDVKTDTRGCEANIRLFNDGELSGVLVASDGRTVRGLVRAFRLDDSIPEPQRSVASYETEVDGRFRLQMINEGKYYIGVSQYRDGRVDYRHTIYYPGVNTSKAAHVFDLKTGEHVDRLRFVIPE